jgi:hypothetical protein
MFPGGACLRPLLVESPNKNLLSTSLFFLCVICRSLASGGKEIELRDVVSLLATLNVETEF